MSDLPLSATQQTVLAMIASGSNARQAAATAGVHRNTIANWLCLSEFRQAFTLAQYEKAIFLREQAQSIAADAYAAIRALIADPGVPAGVRLKAALAIIDRASAPLPEVPEIVPNNAQSEAAPQEGEPLAVVPIRNVGPKIGCNDTCHCGSGLKFKRCCLGKAVPPPASALSAAG